MRFKKKIKELYTTTGSKSNAATTTTPNLPLFPDRPEAASTPRSPSPQSTTPQSPPPPPRSPSPQIISDRYIDDDKLLELCSQRFPSGSYRLSYKFNRWYLDAPDWLDERTLEMCEIDMRI